MNLWGPSIHEILKLMGSACVLSTGFTVVSQAHGRTTYQCNLCPGRPTMAPYEHLQSTTHQNNARLANVATPMEVDQNTDQLFPDVNTTMAFESITEPQTNPEDSDEGEYLQPTREAQQVIFGPHQHMEAEFEDDRNWEDFLFEVVLHQAPPQGNLPTRLNESEESALKGVRSHWYPYKTREGSLD